MDTPDNGPIPHRADTLKVLQFMGEHGEILMLSGDADDYGTRWILHGHQVQPAIARYLLKSGYLAEAGFTEFGARRLALTSQGTRFRENGIAWWGSLSLLQKLKITIFG